MQEERLDLEALRRSAKITVVLAQFKQLLAARGEILTDLVFAASRRHDVSCCCPLSHVLAIDRCRHQVGK